MDFEIGSYCLCDEIILGFLIKKRDTSMLILNMQTHFPKDCVKIKLTVVKS